MNELWPKLIYLTSFINKHFNYNNLMVFAKMYKKKDGLLELFTNINWGIFKFVLFTFEFFINKF